ncbi:hypothetical protein [Cellulomonas aerilata]|uniref:hypothetical protein n=1 Tax=Cellulomonas aerilata TaxID=515326 RepID=UPI0011BFDEC8|nr:hypothetical protein [Cellulomonas aerilata]
MPAPTDSRVRRPARGHGGRAAVVRRAAVAVLGMTVLGGCTDPARPSDGTPPGPVVSAPSSASPEPAPSVPAADEHSAVGTLPDGFPSALLPVPPGAEILVASYAPEGEAGPGAPYAVSLNVRTDLAVAEAVALYRAALVGAGFAETTGGPGGSLSAESTFTRSGGQEIVVVGVLDRDGTRTVTAGGQVLAPA